MRLIKDVDLKNKTVLIRCDFNVGIDAEGRITDDYRIIQSLPTIKLVLKKGAVAVLMSHLEKDGTFPSLLPVSRRLSELLGLEVVFLNDCVGWKVAKQIKSARPGQVILLENLRRNKEEKNNGDVFSRQLAQMGDIYVNDSFSCSHRDHASISGLPKYLPAYAGLLLEKEITNLSKVLKNPQHPFVVIIGGAKVKTKSGLIANIMKTADHILVGSKIGEEILVQKQQLMGRSVSELDIAIDAIDLTSPKIHLPVDGILALPDFSEGYLRTAAIGKMREEEMAYDIGPETIKFFSHIIKDAKTIFFNGPVGFFEKPEFSAGTKAIIEAIARNYGAYRVAGGGETLAAIRKYKAENKFDFLSTGGGAMLEYLAGINLPGVAALESASEIKSNPAPRPKNNPGKNQ